MKRIFWFILLTMTIVGCRVDEHVPIAQLSVEELDIKAAYTTAHVVWTVKSEATIEAVLLEYSTDSTFQTYATSRMTRKDKTDIYMTSLDSLKDGTLYYIRCHAINKVNSNTAGKDSFITRAYDYAKISTDTITNIDVSSATLCATLFDRGTDETPLIGFYVATHEGVNEKDSCIQIATESVKDSIQFSYTLSGLEDNETYYVRAFAKNLKGIAWGKELSFVTTEMLLPTLGPTTLKYVSYTQAICSSEIISDGKGTITERGFCYATTANPTIENNKKVNEGEDKVFNLYLSDLTASTMYYVRAYAINPKGVAYGEQLGFTTKAYSLPTVTTSNVTNIKYTTATCGGEVTDDGGQSVVERGICYSATPNPIISDNKVSSGSGKGEYSCNLSELKEGETYYVRAYATNAIGTTYGEDVTFTTSKHLPNAIYYTAAQKLSETADNNQAGLHIYRFNASIVSHTFEDGEGTIEFNEELTDIGNYAFYGCSNLTSIDIPISVTNIGDYAFSNCSGLSSIEVPSAVTNIGKESFMNCTSLLSISLPNGIIDIGNSAFEGCSKLCSIILPNSIKNIGSSAFSKCTNITSINIPNQVTRIKDWTFYNCTSLVSMTIPENVTLIEGYCAFRGCSSMTSLVIGSNVASIGQWAFLDCSSLSTITCYATTPPTCYNAVFDHVNKALLLYVPAESIPAYQSAYTWKEFYNIFPLNE